MNKYNSFSGYCFTGKERFYLGSALATEGKNTDSVIPRSMIGDLSLVIW